MGFTPDPDLPDAVRTGGNPKVYYTSKDATTRWSAAETLEDLLGVLDFEPDLAKRALHPEVLHAAVEYKEEIGLPLSWRERLYLTFPDRNNDTQIAHIRLATREEYLAVFARSGLTVRSWCDSTGISPRLHERIDRGESKPNKHISGHLETLSRLFKAREELRKVTEIIHEYGLLDVVRSRGSRR